MAYSQEIIQIVADRVGSLTSPPAFITKEMWAYSQFTDVLYPIVILDRPIQERSKITSSGSTQKTYTLLIWIFTGTVAPLADFATYKEPLLIQAEVLKEKILKALSDYSGATGRTKPIDKYTSLEIPETRKADANPCGLMLQLEIVYDSYKSIC